MAPCLPTRLAAALLCLVPHAAPAEPTMALRSVGYETTCAEMDNVLVEMKGSDISAFTVTARHPAYLTPETPDVFAPDFTDCDFPDEPIWTYDNPYEAMLYEDDRVQLKGYRFRHTWRPEDVPFHVAGRSFHGLHLTQLWLKTPDGPYEVIAFYPNDGYWRPRPLPPADRAVTGFGASLLFGPVETDRRPLVRFVEVRFDPKTLTYALRFVQGGWGLVRLAEASREALSLEVTLDMPPGHDTFAMLSSMHVAPDNADIARVAVRGEGSLRWESWPIDRFRSAVGAEADFGRDTPSRHNTTAPDIRFHGLRRNTLKF